MKGKWALSVLLAILGLVSWQTVAGATLYRMRFQINTFQRPATANPPKLVNINIQVSDSVQRPYDAVSSLTVTGPAGFSPVDLKEFWNEGAQAFNIGVPVAADTAPVGTYTAVVVGKDNSQITQTADINGTFLPLPNITSPKPGVKVGSLTPTIKWDPVTGAQYYNLLIQQTSAPQWSTNYQVYRSSSIVSFTVPPGVLKPGAAYMITVNAFDSDKLLTKQSQAGVSFTTP